MAANPRKKEIPVYERLGPKECLVVSKTDDSILVACNEDGKVRLRRVKVDREG